MCVNVQRFPIPELMLGELELYHLAEETNKKCEVWTIKVQLIWVL